MAFGSLWVAVALGRRRSLCLYTPEPTVTSTLPLLYTACLLERVCHLSLPYSGYVEDSPIQFSSNSNSYYSCHSWTYTLVFCSSVPLHPCLPPALLCWTSWDSCHQGAHFLLFLTTAPFCLCLCTWMVFPSLILLPATMLLLGRLTACFLYKPYTMTVLTPSLLPP